MMDNDGRCTGTGMGFVTGIHAGTGIGTGTYVIQCFHRHMFNDDDGGSNSGSAYIFEKPVGGWVDMIQTGKLVASDVIDGDNFGISVSISGDDVIVESHLEEVTGTDVGSAYFYKLN